ncbi:MAG TPA: phytanoyl-CoA dioxygenase family protein [Acidimicrobiales bacterium]|nr:phytanoyl-CoA dioxygenase family protein [Acidimicrobiales bacterium]
MGVHGLTDSDLAAVMRVTPELAPVAFCIGDTVANYRFLPGEGVAVDDGPADPAADVVVSLSPVAWNDLITQVRTLVNLHLANELTYERGGFVQLADWGPLLTLVHCGVPLYDPARVDLSGVDLTRSFTLDDSDDDLRTYLETTGYLHVRGVFSPDEIAAMNAEVDRLAALARRGDDESWWVTDEDGNDVLCRLVYTGMRSDVINDVEYDARVTRLGTLLRADLKPSHDRMEGAAVLLKVPGKTQGLSNIPWHQDCGMGGHAIYCPSVGVGIQLTGSNAEVGNITFVPGSHGQSLHNGWQQRFADVPVVAIDTEPGDVTVHIKDVMHASPRPTGPKETQGWRRTLYVSHFPPSMWDHVGAGQAFNDLVRNRTEEVAAL